MSRLISRLMIVAIVIATIALVLAALTAAKSNRRGRARPIDPAKLQPREDVVGQLDVWGWNIAAKSLQSLVPAFQEQSPKIKVNVQMSGANMETRFLLALASNVGAPDIMQLQASESPRYISTGRMADLTAVAARYRDSFPAASWASCMYEGRVYAIPWDIGPCAVFYKPELFERYGVDVDRIETWDDFISAGKRILDRSGGRTKMLPLNASGLGQMYEMLLQQVRGQVFDHQGRIAINSDSSRQVMDLMRRLQDSGICANVSQFSQEWMAGLNADTIATYPGAVWLGGTIKDTTGAYGSQRSAWRVLRLPAFVRGGPRISNLGGSVLVIPDQSQQKEAAWLFIEFALCRRESQIAQYARFDLFPAFLPALGDPFFSEPDSFYGGQKVGALFAQGVQQIPVLNRTSDWVEALDYVGQSLSLWAVEHQSSPEALQTLAEKLRRRLDRELSPEAPR